MADQGSNGDDKLTVGRGPSYPFIDLERAIERAEQIAAKGAERSKMPPETFYKLWSYGAKSSGARQTMAAMNYYGLVEYVGRGTDRRVTLTDLARRIVLDKRPNSEERARAIATAALEPPIFSELYAQYGPLLPDKVVLESWLKIDRGFNQQGAEATVANFIASIEYAGLDKPSGEPHKAVSQTPTNDVRVNRPRVGDFVEVEIGGQLQFANAVRVRGVTDDGEWFFIDGTETGFSMDQLTVVDRPDGGATRVPPTMSLPEPPKPDFAINDLKPVFDFDSVTINTKITSQWHLTELISRLEKLMPLLPLGDTGQKPN